MTDTRTPVVFIHGLWLHPTSWADRIELFDTAGYAPLAPGWPGVPETVEQARSAPDALADKGIDEVTDHYSLTIDSGWRPVAESCLRWLDKQGL